MGGSVDGSVKWVRIFDSHPKTAAGNPGMTSQVPAERGDRSIFEPAIGVEKDQEISR